MIVRRSRSFAALSAFPVPSASKSAQRFMGHADIKVTLKIYTHLSAQKEKEAIDALNRYLGQNASEKILMQ